jgi:hypothetical protein
MLLSGPGTEGITMALDVTDPYVSADTFDNGHLL